MNNLFEVAGFPVRNRCCNSCNYFFPIDRRPHETADNQFEYPEHRCHTNPGFVCFGSHVGSIEDRSEREQIVQQEVERNMNEQSRFDHAA